MQRHLIVCSSYMQRHLIVRIVGQLTAPHSPQVKMEPIVAKVTKQRQNLKCAVCGLRGRGGCIQCDEKCYVAFHPLCAFFAGHKVQYASLRVCLCACVLVCVLVLSWATDEILSALCCCNRCRSLSNRAAQFGSPRAPWLFCNVVSYLIFLQLYLGAACNQSVEHQNIPNVHIRSESRIPRIRFYSIKPQLSFCNWGAPEGWEGHILRIVHDELGVVCGRFRAFCKKHSEAFESEIVRQEQLELPPEFHRLWVLRQELERCACFTLVHTNTDGGVCSQIRLSGYTLD